MSGVETIGPFKVTPMKDGKFAVTNNAGKMGAFVTDKAGLEEFKAKYNKEKDSVEFAGNAQKAKKSSKLKKFIKGYASFVVPGLGQVFDGRFKDGLKDYAVLIGTLAACFSTANAGFRNFVLKTQAGKTPVGYMIALVACAGLGIANIANRIHSAKDAYQKG